MRPTKDVEIGQQTIDAGSCGGARRLERIPDQDHPVTGRVMRDTEVLGPHLDGRGDLEIATGPRQSRHHGQELGFGVAAERAGPRAVMLPIAKEVRPNDVVHGEQGEIIHAVARISP